MKTSRFTDSQIIAILKQAEGGSPVPELCREHGISNATFYKWRSKFGGMDASLMARNQANNTYMMGVRFTSSGSLSIVMYRTVNGASTVIKDTPVPGVTYRPGTVVHAQFQVSGQGSTTLRGTIWADGAARPATPQVTLTDTTAALQTAGGTGLNAYLSGSATNGPVVLSLDNLVVTKD